MELTEVEIPGIGFGYLRRVKSIRLYWLFPIFLANPFLLRAQNALVFDSVENYIPHLMQDAIYLQGEKLIKADYHGNIIWTKIFPQFYAIHFEGEEIYFHNNRTFFKADSAGNILWAKNLNDFTPCVSDSLYLWNMVINKDRIYLGALQYDSILHKSFNSVLTFDTAGQQINSWCIGGYMADYMNMSGIKSPSGGAWLTYYKHQPFYLTRTLKIGYNGEVDTLGHGHYFGNNFTYFAQILNKSDSSHTHVIQDMEPGLIFHSYLLNVSDDGNTVSFREYFTDSSMSGVTFQNAVIDEHDNMYISGFDDLPLIIKLDSGGNFIAGKGWTPDDFQSYQLRLYYTPPVIRNDSIYIAYKIRNKLTILAFDTLLNSRCYGPTVQKSITDSLRSIIPIGNYAGQTFNYTASDTVITPIPGSNSNGYFDCEMTGIETFQVSKQSLQCFPNPATDEVTISGTNGHHILIYDYNGRKIQTNVNKSGNKLTISTSGLPDGIYLIKSGEVYCKLIKVSK